MATNKTSAEPITATAGAELMAGITTEQRSLLLNAGTNASVEAELQELQDLFGVKILESLFPKENARGEANPSMEKMCADQKSLIANILLAFAKEPYAGSQGAFQFKNLMESVLQASTVGPPIERLPSYKAFTPMVLMTTTPKDFHEARNGIDPLEYEDPIERGEAYNYDPNGGGVQAIPVEGNRTTIKPVFLRTVRHTLSFWEWARRQIKPIIIKKRQILQELAKGWDDALITHFDAVVPDGTLYSAHPTQIVTLAANVADAVTNALFKQAAYYLRHTDASTGTVHIADPGYALTDPLAIDDIMNWGSDFWSEAEVSEFIKTGWTVSDEGLRTGRRVYNFSLLQTPIEKAGANRKVRFFAVKEQVGYFIPVTVNGKTTHVNVAPMSGSDPDFTKMATVAEPPGYTFYLEAWQGGAIQVVNPYALAFINHA